MGKNAVCLAIKWELESCREALRTEMSSERVGSTSLQKRLLSLIRTPQDCY